MQVINLIGWITVPFLMPPFAMSLNFLFQSHLLFIHIFVSIVLLYLLADIIEITSNLIIMRFFDKISNVHINVKGKANFHVQENMLIIFC